MLKESITQGSPGVVSAPCAPNVELRIASRREHYAGAFRLVHDMYCKTGLAQPNPLGMRVTPYQLLDTSQVFVALLNGEVICTLTLVQDGELGLPMEQVYPGQIQERRELGLRIAEVSCLADRRLSPKRFFSLFSDLCRVMAQFARLSEVDEIWIACHPKHAPLYEHRLAFTTRGALTDYPTVLGNPAVPLCLDLRTAAQTHPAAWRQFFHEPIPRDVLRASVLADADRSYFQSILCMADVAAPAASAIAS